MKRDWTEHKCYVEALSHTPANKQYLEGFFVCKKASNHHANLPLEMYSFTL